MLRRLTAFFFIAAGALPITARAQVLLNQSPNALSGLADTNVTESSSFDGNFLAWNNGTSKWQQVPLFPPYLTGYWYAGIPGGGAGAAVAQTQNKVICSPFFVYQTVTIDQLSVDITVPGTSNLEMALYNNTASTNRPGTEIDDTHGVNSVDTSAGGISAALGTSHVLQPGVYWFCIDQNDSIVQYHSISNQNTFVTGLIGSASATNVIGGSMTLGVTGTLTYPGTSSWGSLSGVTWSDVTTNLVPIFAYHVSSP
jgi:hypothetical protein